MKHNKHVVFTSVNFNYLGRALTLARSVKRSSPEIHFVLMLVEPDFEFTTESKEILLGCDSGNVFDEIITLNQLNIEQTDQFKGYSVVEMCTAVKGEVVVHLLAREDSEYVTYLDPDLFFYNSLISIRNEHRNGDVLLTPHLNHVPFTNQVIFNDEMAGVLRHGVFNLGFVSFKNTKNARDIATWWADRLLISSKSDYVNGLFTDQKWWDLSQVYFKEVFIVKNDGWNVAPWNISERRVATIDPMMLTSGYPLLFFHFSKFPSVDFTNKIKVNGNSAPLVELIQRYSEEFNSAESYVKNIMQSLHPLENFVKKEERRIPKMKPRFEILLSNLLVTLARDRFLRRSIAKSSTLKRLARSVYTFCYSLMYKIEVVTNKKTTNLQISNVILDVLLITHKGGGGVSVVVNERIMKLVGLGKTVGVLSQKESGNLTLKLIDKNEEVPLGDNLQLLIENSQEIEIHHLMGLELHINALIRKRIDRVFLHDKYFLSQIPFADTLNYISVPHETAGVNTPLNGNSSYQETNWRKSTKQILENAIEIFAPSQYMINEYRNALPRLEIQKFEMEPPIETSSILSLASKKFCILVISPTGLHKGSSIVIEVAKKISLANRSIIFQVYGDLDISTKFELGKMENVVLIDQVSRPRLRHALLNSRASIGWIPSLTGESYSLALSDFLSSGIQVVSSISGALGERLAEFPGHYLYDPSISNSDLSDLLLSICENKEIEQFAMHVKLT